MLGKLIVSEGGRDRVHEIYDEVTVIGRGVEVDLPLKDPQVSELHCELRRGPRGFKVVDLESRAGTQVNGRFVNQHLLANGDTIRIGEARLTFLGDSAEAAEAEAAQEVVQAARTALPPALPTDASGKPRRYYRHEDGRRKNTSWQTPVALLGVLLALFLVYRWSAGDPEEHPHKTRFLQIENEVADAILEEDLDELRGLLKEVQDYNPGIVSADDLMRVESEIRGKVREIERARAEKGAKELYAEIKRRHPEPVEDAAGLAAMVRDYVARYPIGEHRDELEAWARRTTEYARHGGSKEKAARWKELQTEFEDILGRANASLNDLERALAICDELQGDSVWAANFREELEEGRQLAESLAGQRFERDSKEAVAAHGSGDARRVEAARRVMQAWVAIDRAPWSARAKRLLETL